MTTSDRPAGGERTCPRMNDNKVLQMYYALKRIAKYQSVASLRRYAERDYGVKAAEAIEMAYENVIEEAKRGVRGVRLKQYVGRLPAPVPQREPDA